MFIFYVNLIIHQQIIYLGNRGQQGIYVLCITYNTQLSRMLGNSYLLHVFSGSPFKPVGNSGSRLS